MHIEEFLVDPAAHGTRLDVFLAQKASNITRAQAARLIAEGKVSINSTEALVKSEKLFVGDRVVLCYEDAYFGQAAQGAGLLTPNYAIPLDIRFEDDELIVLSKQADLVCHPAPGHVDDTLANALVAHCGYDHLGLLQGEDRPGIVHRLDRDTSGLMLCAKDDESQKALQDLIRLRVLDRRYVVLVHGYVASDASSINTGIIRSPRDRLRMTVSSSPDAREAITTYKTLARYEAGSFDEGYSLLECHLYTGRTHQIRVHMRHIGHPVVGDPLYGKSQVKASRGLTRQFLHSWSVAFDHPTTHAHLSYQDQLPSDLMAILEQIHPQLMDVTPYGQEIMARLGLEHLGLSTFNPGL